MSANCSTCTCDNQKPQTDLTKIEPIIAKYKDIQGSLITILQKTQDVYGYLPEDAILHIAEATGIKPAKILGVVTFYTQFRLSPIGKHLIMLCQGTACHVNNSEDIEQALCEELAINEGETTPDNLFTLENVACLGCCSLAPVMMIKSPAGSEVYGPLTPAMARKIVADIRTKEQNSKEAAQ